MAKETVRDQFFQSTVPKTKKLSKRDSIPYRGRATDKLSALSTKETEVIPNGYIKSRYLWIVHFSDHFVCIGVRLFRDLTERVATFEGSLLN